MKLGTGSHAQPPGLASPGPRPVGLSLGMEASREKLHKAMLGVQGAPCSMACANAGLVCVKPDMRA